MCYKKKHLSLLWFFSSLFDLKFVLNRLGLPPPVEFGDILRRRMSGKYLANTCTIV